MRQVVVIGGGNTYLNHGAYIDYLKTCEVAIDNFLPKKDWKTSLQETLGSEYQVLVPRMPNRDYVKYEEWKIWFERTFPFIAESVILVGHSLGGMFLAKYLSENTFHKKINKLILISAPFSDSELVEFTLPDSLEPVNKQCGEIHLFHSDDDPVVSVIQVEEYRKRLPDAHFHILSGRGHFNDASFPEFVKIIGNDK